MHEQIFDLVHFGRFEYNSVYSMPVQLRYFYLKKLIDVKEKEKKEMDKASGKINEGDPPKKLYQGPSTK